MSTVDFSGTISQVFEVLSEWIGNIFTMLNNIKIVGEVSLLHIIVAVTIMSMVISALFVLFDAGVDDEN